MIDAQRIRKLIVELMQEIDAVSVVQDPANPSAIDPPMPGEGIMAYAARTSAQTGFPAAAAGALALGIAATTNPSLSGRPDAFRRLSGPGPGPVHRPPRPRRPVR